MIGQTISHYTIEDKLGEGGMGIVFRGHDTKLERTVALKFLPMQLTQSDDDRKRFSREAKAIAALNHPNICTIYSVENYNGFQFMVMEYVDDLTLREKLKSERLPFDSIIDYAVQIADALDEAHSKGIIHRDIKPENIMVNKRNRIKVMDFGLAKLKGSMNLTKTGNTLGTIAYMSPEQIQGEEVDHRSDIFSFGVVLYEMVAGKKPFRGEHEAAIMYEILNADPPSLDSSGKDIPDQLRSLISQLLQKDRSRRIASAREIAEKFKDIKQPPTPALQAPEKSIAVLYFENMSSEKDGDHICAGITEDILTDLSKIKELKVASRTDVFAFRNKEVNIRQVGEALRVNYVLEGSVRKAGNRIRITAQLIDVRDGFHVWAERFDRMIEDIFDVQNEVAQKITDALKVSLTDSEKESLEKKPTDDIRAYDFYMRGRELLQRRGKKNNETAIKMFENAISIDPEFASPYAGLAEASLYMYEWYDGDTAWLGKAITMNQKALSLDPGSLEVRFGIAMVYFHQKRFKESKKTLDAILDENSQYYPACFRLGMLSELSGDNDSALKYFRRATELKPYDEDAWRFLEGVYRKLDDAENARDAALKVIEVTARKLEASLDDVIVMSRLAEAYARFGAQIEARATLNRIFELDRTDGLALYNCACAYALLGEKGKALITLRQAFDNGFKAVARWAKSEKAFDSLRDDSMFREVISELEWWESQKIS
jgi:serine/threonine protein kinase/Flp pilus assembly protein TadD